MTRSARKAGSERETPQTLSIIIPAYNERDGIEAVIRRVRAVDTAPLKMELLVVDDGSTDGTRDVLKRVNGIRAIFHERNLGKGGAVKTGFQHATGDILLIQDADLEYDPEEIPCIVRPILENKVDVVMGVRIQPPRDERRRKSLYWMSWLGNQMITWTTNLLYRHRATEYEGCYKAFRSEIVRSIRVRSNGFDFDNELICTILKRRHRIVEVPIHYHPRSYGEGKKIGWKDGFRILRTIVRCRFERDDRRPVK